MPGDPQSKNARQFNCREYLWDTFDQMSQELDVTVDYLINESMRQFARGRDRGGPYSEVPEQPEQLRGAMGGFRPPMPGMGGPQRPGLPSMGGPQAQQPMAPQGGMGRMPPMSGPTGPQPLQQQPRLPSMATGAPPMGGMQRPGMGGPPPMQQQPPMMQQPMMPPQPQQPRQGLAGMPGMGQGPMTQRPPMPNMGPPPPQQQPQQPRMPPAPQGRAPTQGRTLIAIYEGQQYPVTKEEFVIGRGQKTTDLTIRDSNVSRRHAAVVLYNGQYWIVDQQSTNGIDFNGGKVDRKVVEDGDSYRICDHEIQFVYR